MPASTYDASTERPYHYGDDTHATPGLIPVSVKRTSWGAIFAGAVVALVIQLVLTLAGLAVGSETVDPAQDQDALQGLGLGAGIWWAVSSIIALFVGGWIAGRLAGFPRSLIGCLHGLVVWGLVSLLSFYLATTTVGRIVSGAASAIGTGVSALGQAAEAVAPELTGAAQDLLQQQGITVDEIRQQARQLLQQAANTPQGQQAQQAAQQAATNPDQAMQQLDTLLSRLVEGAADGLQPADRQAIVDVLVQQGISQQEAEQSVNEWQQQIQQAAQQVAQATEEARQTAVETSQKAAEALATASFWATIALVLGGIAAAVGGMLGAPSAVPAAPVRENA